MLNFNTYVNISMNKMCVCKTFPPRLQNDEVFGNVNARVYGSNFIYRMLECFLKPTRAQSSIVRKYGKYEHMVFNKHIKQILRELKPQKIFAAPPLFSCVPPSRRRTTMMTHIHKYFPRISFFHSTIIIIIILKLLHTIFYILTVLNAYMRRR